MTSRKFKSINKDRLFYDRFRYCVSFYLDEVNCLRVLDHAHIDDMLQRRQQWREIAQQRWSTGKKMHGVIMRRRYNSITENTVNDLHVLAEVLLTTSHEFKLVVSVNQGYVYTDSLLLVDQLCDMEQLSHVTLSQAHVTRPKNTVVCKRSAFAFRSYLKNIKLSAEQKHQLTDFLAGQKDHVRLSPGLLRWVDQPFTRTQDYFFVDHSTETWLTMLNLVQPGLIRKTMHIITAK